MAQNPVELVVLCYKPKAALPGIPVAIAVDRGHIQVTIKVGWEADFDPEEVEYLTELMRDWEDAETDRIPAIMGELAELSVGPLRTQRVGKPARTSVAPPEEAGETC
jgi:hypothetical protein